MSSSVIPATTPVSWTAVPDGSAASPSFAFQNSSGTGFYRVSANVLGISTAGVQVGNVSATGVWTLGNATAGSRTHSVKSGSDTVLRIDSGPFTANETASLALGANGQERFWFGYDLAAARASFKYDTSATAFESAATTCADITTGGAWTFGPTTGGPVEHLFRSNSVTTVRINGTGQDTNLNFSLSGVKKWGFNSYAVNDNLYLLNSGGTAGVYLTQASNAWTGYSDARLKKDGTVLDKGLSTVLQMQPKRFNWIANDKEDIGFYAQELKQVLPEAVVGEESDYRVDEESNIRGVMGITPDKIIPVLVKAIQELSAKVEEQSLRLEAQAAEIEALKAKP